MVMRIGSSRKKTKGFTSRHKIFKGKLSITRYLQQFNSGDKVVLKLEPSIHKGWYYRRFHGKVAEVTGKRGRAYEVSLFDGGKHKTLVVLPIHMNKLSMGK